MTTYHYIIQGRVQGVCYRYYAKKSAKELSINGTVKNLFNGDVEIYAQGDEENITIFEKFLNNGPSLSRVKKIIKEKFDCENRFSDFEIIF
jgi:acylphosphatase